MKRRVTMADVAEEIGVAASTVSRALRNDPRISAKVRQEVQEKAVSLGYRPNPLLSALMANRSKSESEDVSGAETLALLTDYGGGVGWRDKDVCCWEYEGMVKRAHELGFVLEEFALPDYAGDLNRAREVIRARGVRGVLLGFSRSRNRRVLLEAETEFVVSGLSAYFREVGVDRANFHGLYNVRLALGEMRKLGYRRIGLVVPELNNRLSGFQWTSGYLDWQRNLSAKDCCAPFVPDGGGVESAFQTWFRREKPHALLVYKLPVKSWLAKMSLRIPEDVGLALLFRTQKEMESAAGIDGNLGMVGSAAVDLVVEGLYGSRTGLPEHPKEVLIKGDWLDGPTLNR
ncbi:MAG: LacI family DNA-binding transcriptional regulator [Verrucomicrobiota bacterium]